MFIFKTPGTFARSVGATFKHTSSSRASSSSTGSQTRAARPVRSRPLPARPTPSPSPRTSPARFTPSTPKPIQQVVRPGNRDAWPWRPATTPTFPLRQGMIEEQRTVYARDPPFRPRMFWFVAAASLISSLMCAELMRGHPDLRGPNGELVLPEGSDDDGVIKQPLRSIPERIQKAMPGVPIWVIRQYLAGGIIAFGGLACIGVLYSPSRVITRLTQCRVRPASASSPSGEVKTFIKMTHAGHLLLPERVQQFRVLDTKQFVVSRIAKGQVTQSVLKVNIIGGPKRLLSFDRHSYRLPFQNKMSNIDPDAEVVVSLRRVEEVFGEIL